MSRLHPSVKDLCPGMYVTRRRGISGAGGDDEPGCIVGRVDKVDHGTQIALVSWPGEYFPGHPDGEYRPGSRRGQAYDLGCLMLLPRLPQAGDAVRLVSPDHTMPELEVYSIGVIEGMVGEVMEEMSLTFNASTYWDDRIVQCSGGPGTILTPMGRLQPTDEVVTITAWSFKDGIRGRDRGVDRKVEVPLWNYVP